MANAIVVDIYEFGVGNKFARKYQEAILTAGIREIIPITAGYGPDPNVYTYSKLLYAAAGGTPKEGYTAETVAQLVTKINA